MVLNNFKTQYDWEHRWRHLAAVKNGRGWVTLLIDEEKVFMEMYRKGYLTGRAFEDAQKIANGEIKYGEN